MKKILFFVVCLSMIGVVANAQNKNAIAPPPPPPPPIEDFAIAPPPPPSAYDDFILAPTPPEPPIPPAPPIPEKWAINKSRVIVNSNGYEISVQEVKGTGMVFLKKNGVSQKIKLSTWNANRKLYEKKYGQLPPPPPPPPFLGQVEYAAPEIKKDIQ